MVKLEPMDYATVVSAKKLKGSGLSSGDVVMVVGAKQVPASLKDPYLTRIVVTVVKLINDLPIMPKEDNDHLAYLVDPRSLEKVVGDEEERLRTTLKTHYDRRSV